MPFKSDKQRRYLWSQKPEVAKQIAYKQSGGPLAPQYLQEGGRGWLHHLGGTLAEVGKMGQEAWSNPFVRGGIEIAGGATPGVGEALDVASGAYGVKKILDGDIGGGALDVGVAGAGLLIPGVTGTSLKGAGRISKAAVDEWGDEAVEYGSDILGGFDDFINESPETLARAWDMTTKEAKEMQEWARKRGREAWYQQEGGAVPPGFYQQRAEFSRLVDEGIIDQKDMLRWEMVDKLKAKGVDPIDAAFQARAMYKQGGGGIYDSGVYDQAAEWWNNKMAGIPQHVGFIDDPDDITETAATNPDDPYGGRFINPDRRAPLGRYTDLATYYTAKQRDMGRGAKELARMKIENERIKREALKRGFINPDGSTNFQEGGEVPMMDNRKPKKVTQKDRYGNQVTVEYESEAKPFDVNSLMSKMMEMEVPPMMEMGFDHPGEPRGSDTVPAWLTPGEFVVNAEAMRDPANAALVERINNEGRALQQMQGGSIPTPQGYQEGGSVPVPVSPTEALLHAREGYRPDVYLDSLGKPTVGYGHLLPDEFVGMEGLELWDEEQLQGFFQEDMESAKSAAMRNAKKHGVDWDKLPRQAQVGLTSQAFQLGETGQDKFENMWANIASGDMDAAAAEALDSKWAEQTPVRAEDLAGALQGKGFEMGGPVYLEDGGFWNTLFPAPPVPSPVTIPPTAPAQASIYNRMVDQDRAETGEPIPYANEEWAAPTTTDNILGAAGALGSDIGTMAAYPYQEYWSQQDIPFTDTTVGEAVDAGIAGAKTAGQAVADTVLPPEASEVTFPETADGSKTPQEEIFETLEAHDAGEEPPIVSAEVAEVLAADGVQTGNEIAVNEAKTADEARQELIDRANEVSSEETGPGSDQAGENATEEEVENAAKNADEETVEQNKSIFQDLFGGLFDKKELARMAVLAAGSMALGYSPLGSLRWAATNYVGRLDAKASAQASSAAQMDKNAFELTKTGKFSPESVQAYRKTGNLSVLQSAGAQWTPTANTNTRSFKGGKVAFQEVKSADGSIGYRDPSSGAIYTAAQLENNSKPFEPAFEKGTPEYRARRSRATGDAAGRFQEVFEAEDVLTNDKGTVVGHRTGIKPKQAADEYWAFMESHGMDPESDESYQIMTNAYRSAIADSEGKEYKPKSLKPYLQQEYIRESTGTTAEFITNPDQVAEGGQPKFVNVDKMRVITDEVQHVADNNGKSRDEVFQFLLSKWNNLDNSAKKGYKGNNDESPFYVFMQSELFSLYK